MWLACAVLMTACSDLDEQVEQLMVQKEQTETIAPNETDKSAAETKAVEYTNIQTITLTTHGTLKEQLGDNLTTTDKLILSGPIDATDVDVFRNQMTALKAIDMTDVTFVESDATYIYNSYYGYTASLKYGVIPEAMFNGLDNFVEIKLPKEVTQLESNAFYECSSLQTIELPENLETLGAGVFQYCPNLKNVTLSKNLKEIGDNAFESTAIENITLPETLATLGWRTFYRCEYLKEIKIPELVTVIPNDCFLGCTSMVSVTLPDGITHIEDRAFCDCFVLTKVNLPSSLTFLGSESFSNCLSLTFTSPMLPASLITMERRVFANNRSLKELVFPAGLTEIAEYTCYECSALERVVISEGTTMIGTNAFMDTHALTEVTLPSTMKVIGGGAFQNAGVTSLSFLPDGIETIKGYAFSGCPIKDKVITLPSITSIESYAFEGNMTIGAIRITGTQDVLLNDLFGKASNCLIYASGTVTLPTNEYIYNKIANGRCLKLRLVEDSPWYCPEAFAVGMVTLTKQFNQDYYNTNYPVYAVSGKASNWYAFNMPFVPDEITSADGRTWAPFNADVEGAKPFWLRKLTTDTKKPFVDVTEIEADVPYIISFPCNENYDAEYNLCGDITFTATNITIPKTGDQIVLSGPYYSMFSSYEPIPQASSVYLLNSAHYEPNGVRKDYNDVWGSAFEQSLRESWAWEPYISFSSPTATRTISLDGASTRSHKEVGSIPSIDDM